MAAERDLGGAQIFLEDAVFRTSLVDTLIVCAIVIILGTVINLLAGVAVACFEFRGRNLLFVICLVTFMVPFEGIVIPLLSMMQGLRLVDTLPAVILPTVASGFLIFLFRQFFLGVPRNLREAAMIDGASTMRILTRIYVPLSRPLIITSCIVLFIAQWQALFLPLVLLRSRENWLVQMAWRRCRGRPSSSHGVPCSLVLPSS